MSIDVSPVISALDDAGLAVVGVGSAVVLVVVVVKSFSWLKLSFADFMSERRLSAWERDEPAAAAKAHRMSTYRELRADGWSPSEIEVGTKYTGPGSTHYGP